MNYIFYIIIILSAVGFILIPQIFKRRLNLDFYSKQAIKNILARKPVFFSTLVVREAVKRSLEKHSEKSLDALIEGKASAAAKHLPSNDLISILLKGFDTPQAAIKKVQQLLKKSPQNSSLAVWLALLAESTQNTVQAQAAWDNVSDKKLSLYLKAHSQAHLALSALKNGDMEFASRLFYQAAALFNKSKAFYEEGRIYLQLGTIYRVCFIDDVAETLFLSALKTFQLLRFDDGIAKTYAYLGVLMTGQERFEEAESYFQKALDIYTEVKDDLSRAEIKNQQALMFLLRQQYKQAQKLLTEAKKYHLRLKNNNGIAFSMELAANCFWKTEDYASVVKQAEKAADFYRKSKNISGLLDSLYLKAQALFKLNMDTESEKTLRQILEIGKQDCGCFYLANAYNLLGIIYMRQKDLRRAKGLFQQSLDLEQRGVRLNALAADYANIGLVELSGGHFETAKQHLQTALDFARQIEDEELCSTIQKQLNRINN